MIRVRQFALAALCALVPAALGCAADATADAPADDQGAGGQGEDEIRAALLGNVAAVRLNGTKFEGGPVVAAPGKVRRILENIGLQPGAPRPAEGGVRCPPGYRFDVLDAVGAVKASGGFMCGGPGSGDRKDAKGSIQVGGKSYLITAKDVDGIDAIAKEPLAVADVLFGADRAQIGRPSQPASRKETKDGALVAKLVKSMQGDQVPDPQVSPPRCMPTQGVTFLKGAKEIASVTFMCGDGERGVVQAQFSDEGGKVRGGVKLNAGVVFDVEAALAAH